MASQLVYLKTFGCQMNEHDSENILNLLASLDYESTLDPKKADLILINTCSVREKSEQKVYSLLGRLKRHKKNGKMLLGVGGCVAQQEGSKLLEKAPFVDLIFGTNNIPCLPDLIKAVKQSGGVRVATEFQEGLIFFPLSGSVASSQIKAYVTIMEGCDNFCSFCVVPFVRGREKSRPSCEIIKEIINLASQGVKEITLLGQNVNSYGSTLAGEISFAGLLKEVNKIEGIERIRFTTSHPKDLSEELTNCFHDQAKLCPHIHLPLQSGSNRILKMMNRGYTQEEYFSKIKKLRAVCPDIAITTDLIVGFPGETEEDFHATLDMVTTIEYDEFFSFKYSDRQNTQASQYPDKLPEEKKDRRLSLLQEKQRSITMKKNRTLIGTTVDVLVEGESKKNPLHVSGRSGSNKVVNFEGPLSLKGTIVPIKISHAYPHSLFGCLTA